MSAEDRTTLLSSLPCPELLLCVRAGGETDVATVTAMWVSYEPVIAAVYLRPGTTAHRLVATAREFTLNLVDEAQDRAALTAGSLSGADPDKLSRLGLEFTAPRAVESPRIRGAAAHYECRVVGITPCGSHDLILGVVTAWDAPGGTPVIRYGHRSHRLGDPIPGPDVAYPH